MPERYQNGFDRAQQYFDYVRQMLMMGTGVGGAPSPMNPGGFVQSMDPGLMSSNSPRNMNGMQIARGTTPSDAQVLSHIAATGGNPFLQDPLTASQAASRGMPANNNPVGGYGGSTFSTGDPLMDQYLARVEQEQLKANLVNDQRERNVDAIYKDRERQADAELTAMRDRVMGEVDNWGGVQEKLNAERAASALAQQRANLAASGFDMSTHMPAFAARNARDLALTQQDLSEKKSDRRVRYDSQLTADLARMRAQLAGDRAAFLERPTDNGPDMGQAMQLAMQYGAGNSGQGFAGGGPTPSQYSGGGMSGGSTPPAYASGLGFMQMPSPVSMAPAWFGGGGQVQPQPQQFSYEGPQSSNTMGVARQQAKAAARDRRIADRRAAGAFLPGAQRRALAYSQPFRLF